MKDLNIFTAQPRQMTEQEVAEMQRKIDEGILRAQQKLIARAKHDNIPLVVARDGKVVEVPPEEL